MPRKSIGLLFTVTILATGILVVLLAVLSYPGAAGAEINQPGETNMLEKSTLDPRWLDLITAFDGRGAAQIMNGTPSINVDLTAEAVAGLTDSPLPVHITATRGSMVMMAARVDPMPVDLVYLYQVAIECERYQTYCTEFETGDVIWVAQGGDIISMTIPLLTAFADANSDEIHGEAPAGEPVTVYLFPSMDPNTYLTGTVTVDGVGAYRMGWGPGYDVIAADDGYTRYSAAVGQATFIRYMAPLVRVEAYGLEVAGLVTPRSEVEVEVTDSGGQIIRRGRATSDDRGVFSTLIYNYWGLYDMPSIFLQPGYEVKVETGGQQISVTVADLSAEVDLSAQTIWGSGPSGSVLGFVKMPGPLSNESQSLWFWDPVEKFTTTVAGSGEFLASTQLQAGNFGAVVHRDSKGQQTFSRFTTPYLWARMGPSIPHWRTADKLYFGQLGDSNQVITVSVQGPSGFLKDYERLPAFNNGYFGLYQGEYLENITLDYGDILTVSSSEGTEITLALPNITVEVDPQNFVVSGLAPPGAELTVKIFEDYVPWAPPYPPPVDTGGGYQPLVLDLTATPEGTYLADFSSLGGFEVDSSGVVQMTFPDGNQVARTFFGGSLCPPLLEGAQVSGNRVSIGTSHDCAGGTIKLKDPLGGVKAQIELDHPESIFGYEFWDGNQPVLILPGDTLEIEAGGESLTWIVPELSLEADWTTDQISGRGTPGEELAIDIESYGFWNYVYDNLTTTVNVEGDFSLDLSGRFDLRPGDYIYAAQTGDPPQFFTVNLIPIVRARINSSEVNGVLAPLSPYTLALETATDSHVIAPGFTDLLGHFYRYIYSIEEEGAEVLVQPGDTIVITSPGQVIEFPIPWLTANVDPPAAQVYGEAPPNSALNIYLNTDTRWGNKAITSTVDGSYAVGFPELRPFIHVMGEINHANEDGNQTTLFFSSRHLDLTLGAPCVEGIINAPLTEYTLTYRSTDGSFEEVYTGESGGYDGFISACFSINIVPGYELVLEDPTGTMVYQIPHVSAQYDDSRGVIVGQALPNGAIEFTFIVDGNYWEPAIRHVISTVDGGYGVDISDLDLVPDQYGTIKVTDRYGNVVRMMFEQTAKDYFPMLYWRWQD